MKSFVALNFIAGFLHYLYLVVASRQLALADFSSISAWLAYLSFAFVLAGVFQYLSCFLPLSRKSVGFLVAAGLAGAGAVCALPFLLPFHPIMTGVLAGALACAFGVFLGQAQARLLFLGMSAGNFAVGAFKLILALTLPMAVPDRFFWAVPLAYIPAMILLCFMLIRSRADPPRGESVGGAILSTFVLGAASALFPQFELMLMRSTQTAEVFDAFARLSLFYKAIFFVFLIFSQWLLPYQLRDPRRAGKTLADPRLYLGTVALAALGAVLGPWIATLALGWSQAPSGLLIYLSCWNMGLLTWIFLLLQDFTAKKQVAYAVALILAAFALVPVQWAGAFPVAVYFAGAIGWNTLLIWGSVTFSGARNRGSSSPANAA